MARQTSPAAIEKYPAKGQGTWPGNDPDRQPAAAVACLCDHGRAERLFYSPVPEARCVRLPATKRGKNSASLQMAESRTVAAA